MLGDMPNFNEILPKTGEGKWMVTIDTSSLNSKPKSKSARVTYYEEGDPLEEGNFLFVISEIGAILLPCKLGLANRDLWGLVCCSKRIAFYNKP